ncbi:MAG: LrgA family protein [Polaromonas sp.]|nr:LrgA family protein [Polaromonas sp.]
MNALRGMTWLLVFQSLGELLARGLALPLPGPVIGMVLLLVALRWPVVRAPVGACADFLLSHLSLLFVPVGVGVMTHLGLVSQYGVRLAGVLVLSTLAGLAVTVLSLHLLRDRHPEGGANSTNAAAAGGPVKDADV